MSKMILKFAVAGLMLLFAFSLRADYKTGYDLFQEGKFEAALVEFNKVVADKDAETYRKELSQIRIGHCYWAMKQYENAITAYEAVTSDNADYMALARLRIAMSKTRLKQDAEADYVAVLSFTLEGIDLVREATNNIKNMEAQGVIDGFVVQLTNQPKTKVVTVKDVKTTVTSDERVFLLTLAKKNAVLSRGILTAMSSDAEIVAELLPYAATEKMSYQDRLAFLLTLRSGLAGQLLDENARLISSGIASEIESVEELIEKSKQLER